MHIKYEAYRHCARRVLVDDAALSLGVHFLLDDLRVVENVSDVRHQWHHQCLVFRKHLKRFYNMPFWAQI